MNGPAIRILPDPTALAEAVAERFATLSAEAIAARGAFHAALAGGSTPRRAYELLSGSAFAGRVDWPRVHLWVGDERCVPPEHPERNSRMVVEALAARLPPPGPRLHCMEPERGNLWVAAAEYARALAREVRPGPAGIPALDLVLLGLGADGHTASLFPGTCILRDHRLAAAVYVPRLHAWRMSLTLPVLNAGRHVLFVVAGADKADAVRRVLRGEPGGVPLPAARVAPSAVLEWYLDRAAAARL